MLFKDAVVRKRIVTARPICTICYSCSISW